MSIQIRGIRNDDLPALADRLTGLYVQVDFMDTRGRLVSGKFLGARLVPAGLAITLERTLDAGEPVRDSALVSPGLNPLGQPWRTTFHIPDTHPLLQELERAENIPAAA